MGKKGAKARKCPGLIIYWALTNTEEVIGTDEIYWIDCSKINDSSFEAI